MISNQIAYFNGAPISNLLDTGADFTVISETAFRKFNIPLDPIDTFVANRVGNSLLNILGWVNDDFCLREKQLRTSAAI